MVHHLCVRVSAAQGQGLLSKLSYKETPEKLYCLAPPSRNSSPWFHEPDNDQTLQLPESLPDSLPDLLVLGPLPLSDCAAAALPAHRDPRRFPVADAFELPLHILLHPPRALPSPADPFRQQEEQKVYTHTSKIGTRPLRDISQMR